MAQWDKILSRGNVEDRRGWAPAVGGISLTGVALLLILNLLSGGDASDVLGQLQEIPIQQTQQLTTEEFEGADSYEVFASTVLGSNNEMWSKLFSEKGETYNPPKLVLFRQAVESACGTAPSEVGPFYCPLDKTIYLDETFFDELETRFGAKGGDVAEAYVITHEAGHHAQNELGILGQGSSVSLELQADCFAGLWVNSIKDMNILEPNEVMEAMDAAEAVGDDRVQQRLTGTVSPETWTHGSAEQRKDSLNRGYTEGKLSACNI